MKKIKISPRQQAQGKVKLCFLAFFICLLFACTNPMMEWLFLSDKEINTSVTYTVTFDSGGGSPVPSQTVVHGGKATRPDNNSLTKSGFGFIAWYSDPALTTVYDFDTPVFGNITLYASWAQNTAYITITVDQITDLSFDDIEGGTMYRNGNPTFIDFEYIDDDIGTYTCEWTIDGVGAYAHLGLITLSTTAFCTVYAETNEESIQYNSSGRHAVYLDVVKDEIPYRKIIWVTIVDVPVFVDATGVTLDKTSLSMFVGDTETLTPIFMPSYATNQNVTWSISPSGIATVSNGVVSARAVGNATITVTTADGGHTATCTVTVNPVSVTGISLDKTTLALAVNGTETLTATLTPANATNKNVIWTVTPPARAVITNGRVTGIAAGTATVYVTTEDGGYTATCAVTITASSNLNDIDFGIGAAAPTTIGVANADQWEAAKTTIAGGGNDKNYIINVTGSFTVPGATSNTFGNATGIKVSLRGSRTLTLSGTGRMITIRDGQTVILRELTLRGNSENNNSLVYVRGTFIMQSGTISRNTTANSTDGVGVFVYGTFIMLDGTISGNTGTGYSDGAGVSVGINGTFTMINGTISGNTTAYRGGGVFVTYGTFTMYNGTISGNKAQFGGGVFVSAATFRIVKGTIYGTNATTASLRNTVTETTLGTAALGIVNGGTAQRGTFSGPIGEWVRSGTLSDTNNTISY